MAVLGAVGPAAAANQSTQTGETVPPLSTPMVGGYLLSDPPRFSRVNMDLVTHFFWAFSTIRNGACTTASANGINEVLQTRQARPNLKVIRSIGGWGAANFSDVSSTDAKRKAFVASCINAFVANGATDGFDLDWEFPVSGGLPNIGYLPNDRENFNLLVDEFRAQLNAYADAHGRSRRDFLVTAALPAGRWQDSGNGVTGAPYDTNTSFDLETLGRTLDNINVMTYDMGTGYSPVSMFNQPLYRHADDNTGDQYNSTDDAIRYYLEHGVPRNKMTLGTEFTLSRGFVVTNTNNNGLFQPWTGTGCGQTSPTNALNPTNTSVLINWDAQVQSQYLWNPTTRTLCSYETAHSLGIRSQYAKDQGLNGVFTWELTGDASGSQLRAISLPWQPEKVTGAPAPTVNGTTFLPKAGQSFSGTVATVSGSSASSLTAIINWGDLTRSQGTVTPAGNGEFTISGTHTYATAGAYPLTVTIIDPDPLNSRMVNGYAFVDSSPYAYLEGLVSKFAKDSGAANGLIAKVKSASQAPNGNARAGKLHAFTNQVSAQTGKTFTPGQAEILTQIADSLR
ncbi:glycoside hydrolase family 18 protein [Microtetraspora fusca]|uniref:chitinase n=1 Tax=Microtetraspora fusca TaxID=1997 RepID=A0ABW6UX70_MICFU